MYLQTANPRYSQLTVSTTFYPTPSNTVVSYQDSQSRAYYQPYNETTNPVGYETFGQRREREHTLLKNAVDSVSSQVPGSLDIDGDGDGKVDNVCFIVYGGPTGWDSLLWPHMWSLYDQYVYINGKRVYTYNFQLQTSLAYSGVGVLCHEMFHSLGAPDLYHYSTCSSNPGIAPVGRWDLMEYDLNPPQHMGAYMKYRYGTWISTIPEITTNGTYTLNPLTSSTNNCYRIASPNSSTEYFVVEYRRNIGTFESSLPGSGLLVYRINTSQDGQGNDCGPPDEVYIYRPGGTTTLNGSPYSANYSSDVGRTSINDSTDPSSFLSDGSAGGLNISDIGSADSTISFYVNFSAETPTLQYSWDMETNPGWTTQGLWAWGTPTGGGGAHGGPDPTSGYTGSNVYGYNLSGDYENDLPERHLTSTAINCSGLSNVSLKFRRWLGVESPTYDHAYVRVSKDGANWTTLWQNTAQVWDTSWVLQNLDISSVADGQSTVYLRWTMGTTDYSWQYCGWNIDDVEIWGVGTAPSCPDCSGDNVNLQNVTFPVGKACECVATTSITIGTGVTIPNGANVTFKAPTITVQPGYHAENGSNVYMKQE